MRELIREELRRLSGNFFLAAMIFGLPVAFTVLFGLVYRENVVNRITLAVCDEEQSALSRNLISMYADSEKFQIVAHVTSEEELRQEILEGRAKSALLILKNFSREIKLGRGAEILFMVNSANNFFGNAALSAVQEITKTFSTAVSQKLFEGQNLLPAAAMSAAYPIRLGVRILGNPTNGYSPFMLSGLLLNGVQIGIMITILPVFNEEFARQKSGEKFWLAAKLLPYEVLSLAGYAVSLILMVNFFAVPMRGSWLEALILGAAYIFCVSSVLLIFAVCAPNKVLALQSPLIYIMPGLLCSGLSFPLFEMSDAAEAIAKLMPITYVGDNLRDILLTGYAPNLWSDCRTMIFGGAAAFLSAIAPRPAPVFIFIRRAACVPAAVQNNLLDERGAGNSAGDSRRRKFKAQPQNCYGVFGQRQFQNCIADRFGRKNAGTFAREKSVRGN